MSSDDTGWFKRKSLPRTGPLRTAGHYFRSAARDGKGKDGRAVGGIPLSSTEAAVVAAVRMAYRVAETQIDRSARLARRLRDEGDRASGAHSDKQAVDATERLVFRGMMTFLNWIETAASDNGNPLRRIGAAQYRLLGAILGLTPSDAATRPEPQASERSVEGAARESKRSATSDQERPRFPVRIQHLGQDRRAVDITAWEYAGEAGPTTIEVNFYSVKQRPGPPLSGELVIDRRSVTLRLATSSSTAAGRWRAALCDATGLQVGRIEIML